MIEPAAAGTPAFQVESASQILMDLGRLIVQDPDYRNADWQAIAVVAYDGGSAVFGYMYRRDGTWRGQAPHGFDFLDRARDLNKAMTKPGEPGWKSALFQIKRDDMELKAAFEYADASRWRVTPGNLEQRVEELRPR